MMLLLWTYYIHAVFFWIIAANVITKLPLVVSFTVVQPPSLLSSSSSSSSLFRHRYYSTTTTNTNEKEDKIVTTFNPTLNNDGEEEKKKSGMKIVLVAGFESFNRELYELAAKEVDGVNLIVFADSDIRNSSTDGSCNPALEQAMKGADAIIGSLIFDYDDVLIIKELSERITSSGPRCMFECATELMSLNRIGTFSMTTNNNEQQPSGPPAPVKKILSLFSSGKEEDKLAGYLKLLKMGPSLLKYIPGEKAKDLKVWLEIYRYWNQGGKVNVQSMLQLLASQYQQQSSSSSSSSSSTSSSSSSSVTVLPELQVTPDIGLIHPLLRHHTSYMESPREYLNWRLSSSTYAKAQEEELELAPRTSPVVAVLLYRKHVITEQEYLYDLIAKMEQQGLIPVPIFINGVEAHTIVRDLLTSPYKSSSSSSSSSSTYQPKKAISVDAIVNTIGFPLVGGPAGSMDAGRNIDISQTLLQNMNVPYFVAGPLLLQSIEQWKEYGVLGLQSVVLYSLPELDGAIDTVVLGGLVGDDIELVPERVQRLTGRVKKWVELRHTPTNDRQISIVLYGFPPNVGAVGTAALLDVPTSLEQLLKRLKSEGYNVGNFDPSTKEEDEDDGSCFSSSSSGQSLVAALSVLCETSVISRGAHHMQDALDAKIARAQAGDATVAATLAQPGDGGLGGATVRAMDLSMDDLEQVMGRRMTDKVRTAWEKKKSSGAPGMSSKGSMVVAGLQLGNIWITVQPLLGIEGDPMRLLFQRDLTPHPQYCAAYHYMRLDQNQGGIGAQAVIHFGMHGTEEWLPGQPLGNDEDSWSDELMGDLPNLYVYAANNPSESILAKRRGYGTIVSYNVPPYGRSGLYLELANIKELLEEYRQQQQQQQQQSSQDQDDPKQDLRNAIWNNVFQSGMNQDVPLIYKDGTVVVNSVDLPEDLSNDVFEDWLVPLSDYLMELQTRLFSSGLHVLGQSPTDEQLLSYIQAYFNDTLEHPEQLIADWRQHHQQQQQQIQTKQQNDNDVVSSFFNFVRNFIDSQTKKEEEQEEEEGSVNTKEVYDILDRLDKTTEEMDSVMRGLEGGYIPSAMGGDLLRDGPNVLPTGRNIYSLDPYRMPSAGAWIRGQRIADELLRQHQEANDGAYPETIAVTMWGLDAIKTRGESIAIALALVGAQPIKEGTGRIVRFDLLPLSQLKNGRPRIDVLASLSGIFRDSFGNVVDLLDDMFERAAVAEGESPDMNYIKKHALELSGVVDRPAARLFSNPPGDYGSMVNEVVGTGDWEDSETLGDTWRNRNVYSYGRTDTNQARPQVLDKLLETTERIVQEVDSVEYGLTDIQEYYANTGALKKAAETKKQKSGKNNKKVALSIVEAFTSNAKDVDNDNTNNYAPRIAVRDVEDVLRLEYRSKLLNPKWTKAMIEQGSGGAYEVSQRFTAMIGWAATSQVDNFVFDQAAERYALDEKIATQLQQSNPEAFKNVIGRLLEAEGRGMWSTDDTTLQTLRDLYSDADDLLEQGGSTL